MRTPVYQAPRHGVHGVFLPLFRAIGFLLMSVLPSRHPGLPSFLSFCLWSVCLFTFVIYQSTSSVCVALCPGRSILFLSATSAVSTNKNEQNFNPLRRRRILLRKRSENPVRAFKRQSAGRVVRESGVGAVHGTGTLSPSHQARALLPHHTQPLRNQIPHTRVAGQRREIE